MNTNLLDLFMDPVLSFTNPFIFKKVIANPEDNYIILRSFIQSILGGSEICKLQILNSENNFANQFCYDIKVELETKEIIEVLLEMQNPLSSKSEIMERAAYYTALHAKNDDQAITSVLLCDFPIFEREEKWKAIYKFTDDDIEKEEPSNILTDKMKVIVLEIDKVDLFANIPIEQLNALQRWIILFKMENIKQILALIKEEPVFKKALDKLLEIKQNKIEYAWAESHFKYVTDEIAFRLDAQAQGKEEGLKEGEEKGKKETKYQMAKQMLDENLDIDLIIRITGLSEEEILKLKK